MKWLRARRLRKLQAKQADAELVAWADDLVQPTGTFLSGHGLMIDGELVTLCVHGCETCGRRCDRPGEHQSDHWGHVCQECLDATVLW